MRKSDVFGLFLISFLTLFFELAMIRWIPGTVAAIGYFTNLILISSFLGMGLGCLLAGRKDFSRFLPALFFATVIVAVLIKKIGVAPSQNLSDFIFVDFSGQALPLILVMPLVFFVNFLFFVPLGQILGRFFEKFQPLRAYAINILGAIAGIVVFTLLSFLSVPPVAWFSVGAACTLWFLRGKKIHFVSGILFFAIALSVIVIVAENEVWSPYQKLVVTPETGNNYFSLTVNNNYYLSATKFDQQTIKKYEINKAWAEIYNLPYEFAQPKDVLILGSGGANDLFFALKSGAEHIDAVEIDQKIVEISSQKRKDGAYGDSRVSIIVDDARTYLKSTDKKYDLIVYGFLDSHRLFSTMANVRLDNFVYTLEGINEAKKRLKDGGVISLSFFANREWVAQKLFDLLSENFGQKPLVFESAAMPSEKVMLVTNTSGGLLKENVPNFNETSGAYAKNSGKYKVPSDNWPYLYLENNFIPPEYIIILIIIFAASAAAVFFSIKSGADAGILGNLQFFFLGAAFMLLETKSIVELSLIFGTNWFVNAVVITFILVMILAANLFVIKFNPKKIRYFYALLFLTLIFNFIFPPKNIPFDNPVIRLIAPAFIATLPIFFAGLVFSSLFKKTKNASLSLGLNILGGVLGGFLEYASLIFGIGHIILLAVILYVLSMAFAGLLGFGKD
ncbi:MAG: hypothetical protein HY394_06160 [Candidatus Diapherotrites archaeon]|nr:hypothetical protein [Candidatus Diapherotrites archaeon]